MFRRDYLSWWFRPRFLQPWGKQKKILFAGPWVGEFGWELMHWQGFLRKLAPQYEEVIICCRNGNQAIYQDFAHKFVTHNIRGIAECNDLSHIENIEELKKVISNVPRHADHLRPLGFQPLHRQKFIRFGNPQGERTKTILFHPRGRNFGTSRNWKKEKWIELINHIKKNDISLGCVGLHGDTLDIEGDFKDFRNFPLEKLMNVFNSAALIVGPSSGPMHLASLCGLPHLVWTDRVAYAHGHKNRDKYEKLWNPLDTPVHVLDEEGFDPSVEFVLSQCDQFLAKLRDIENLK